MIRTSRPSRSRRSAVWDAAFSPASSASAPMMTRCTIDGRCIDIIPDVPTPTHTGMPVCCWSVSPSSKPSHKISSGAAGANRTAPQRIDPSESFADYIHCKHSQNWLIRFQQEPLPISAISRPEFHDKAKAFAHLKASSKPRLATSNVTRTKSAGMPR